MTTPQMTESKAAAVLDLCRHGLWPIPNWWPLPDGRCACGKPDCDSPGKHPIPTWKPYQYRAPTETEVRNWLTKFPEANWGSVLGEAAGVELPACATWRSPGGAKVLLRHPGGSFAKKIRLLKGDGCAVDLLADGSQVVFPPSRHYSGGRYEWVIPLDDGIAEIPAALLALARQSALDNGNGRPAGAPPIADSIPKGQRNRDLASLAGTMRRRGMSQEAILAALREENKRCAPPLPDAEAQDIARSVGRYEPAVEPSAMVTEHLTDLENGRRLVVRYGDGFRWCEAWASFLVWDGRRWAKDDSGQVMRWAKDTTRGMYAEAADTADESMRKALGAHALRAEADAKLRAMVNLAKSEEGIPIAPRNLDTDPMLLNVDNGTLELQTGTLRKPRPEDFLTKLAPVAYAPDATAPVFLAFLERIFDGNTDLIGFVQRLGGYSLTGRTIEQVWALLHGGGANGKSTLLRTLIDLLGDYAAWTPAKTLLAKRGESADNDLARLRGARLVASVETDGGRRLAEALVKQLTGGDKIAARFLYSEYFEFAPEFKLWLATNHRPKIEGTDNATWRRVRLVPFTVEIPEAEQDKDLLDKLRGEFPGILRWLVEGCLTWQRDGLGTPEAVREATAEYRQSQDLIGAFLAECCEVCEGATAGATDLYRAYTAWCEQGKERPETQTGFGEALARRGFTDKRHTVTGRRMRVGIRLLSWRTEESEQSEGQNGNF